MNEIYFYISTLTKFKYLFVQNIHDSEAAEIDFINDKIRNIYDKQLVTGTGYFSCFT